MTDCKVKIRRWENCVCRSAPTKHNDTMPPPPLPHMRMRIREWTLGLAKCQLDLTEGSSRAGFQQNYRAACLVVIKLLLTLKCRQRFFQPQSLNIRTLRTVQCGKPLHRMSGILQQFAGKNMSTRRIHTYMFGNVLQCKSKSVEQTTSLHGGASLALPKHCTQFMSRPKTLLYRFT